ncbi:signal recognition particle-docking protein FtsY [Anaerotignum sp. MSJ-24]|uniref:signal recognition particle-docking protein FtsY n=1 Tax=Anaerotignum sp. MSJ-24 TaxID=2841521 RepID=UPI001C11B4A0|nr:signal recognition particle-docking protein FtsY [Anaerotignum sp. MSJ-24]MBU5464762.1 signal recognition particle-docking protein FtsY [Anaerotignum sp. MSJ-24]
MGFFDFLKGAEYRNKEEDVKTEETNAEESVEQIVHEVADEIEEETNEPVSDEVVSEVVENVTQIENEINDDVTEHVNNPEAFEEEESEEIEEETSEEATEEEQPEEANEEAVEEAETEETVEETENEEEETEESDTEENGEVEDEQPEEEHKLGFFARLKLGLEKTKKNIFGGIESVLGGFTKIDDDLFDELEEALIMADLGVDTTLKVIENLKKRVKKEHAEDPALITGMLQDEIAEILVEGAEEEFKIVPPTVILVIGVNGVGKTTTIGKLAANYKAEGKSVMLAAADTFRAAAIDQLKIWGERSGVDVICHEENSDPAAVVFDAVNAAKNRKTDVLICDTAGRLHNKKNLMDELKKIARVIGREYPEANTEVFLVLDATTGQNALQQAKLFNEVADITGLILTKLDGTAKGGIVIAIKNELNIPVRYIGVGEGIADLQEFNPSEFAKALFEK